MLLAFRVRCFGGSVPQVEVLKVGALDVGSKLLASQGKAGNWVFPPDYMALYWE